MTQDYSYPLNDELVPWDYFDDDDYQLPAQDWPPTDEELADRCGYCRATDGQCSH